MKPVSTILSILVILSASLHGGSVPDVARSVSIEDLRTEISARNAERAGNIREVQTLLRHREVQKLGHLFDLEKIEAAIPNLDDATLARLADESARMNERFRAGDSETQCRCDSEKQCKWDWKASAIFWGAIVSIVAITVLQ